MDAKQLPVPPAPTLPCAPMGAWPAIPNCWQLERQSGRPVWSPCSTRPTGSTANCAGKGCSDRRSGWRKTALPSRRACTSCCATIRCYAATPPREHCISGKAANRCKLATPCAIRNSPRCCDESRPAGPTHCTGGRPRSAWSPLSPIAAGRCGRRIFVTIGRKRASLCAAPIASGASAACHPRRRVESASSRYSAFWNIAACLPPSPQRPMRRTTSPRLVGWPTLIAPATSPTLITSRFRSGHWSTHAICGNAHVFWIPDAASESPSPGNYRPIARRRTTTRPSFPRPHTFRSSTRPAMPWRSPVRSKAHSVAVSRSMATC